MEEKTNKTTETTTKARTETKQDKQEYRKNMMLVEPMRRIIPKMAWPCIVSFVISSIYNLADTYFVSSLGTDATAAVSVNSSLDSIVMLAGSLFAIGAASFIARLLGAKQEEHASRVLSTSLFLAMGLGLVILIAGVVFIKPLVRLLGATDACEQYAIDYARYVLLVAPFMSANFVMNACLRSEGSATLSMIGMGFGGVLNCFLDHLFIFKFGLGVAGASMATAISKLVSFGILIVPYLTGRSLLRLRLSNFRPTFAMLKETLSIGSSSAFRMLLNIVAAIVLNKLAGGISDSVLAGVGVCNKIMMFPFGFVLGFGTGFEPVAGFNWGAKRFDRVMESYRFASRTAIIGSALMAALLALGARWIVSLFSVNDAELVWFGALCIRLQCIALPLHAWSTVINMLCSGLGYAKNAFFIATARQGTCFLPITYPLFLLFGAVGLASVQAVADALTMAIALPLLYKVLKDIRWNIRVMAEGKGEAALRGPRANVPAKE